MKKLTKIKLLRLERGMKQTDVAAAIGVTRAAYANYESGFREPRLELLRKLAGLYSVGIGELLTEPELTAEPAAKETDSRDPAPKSLGGDRELRLLYGFRLISEEARRRIEHALDYEVEQAGKSIT